MLIQGISSVRDSNLSGASRDLASLVDIYIANFVGVEKY